MVGEMKWPDWVIIPLRSREPAGAARVAAALGALGGVSQVGPHVWQLAHREVRLQIEYVDAPFPTHEAPAYISISGGELFETTLLDTLDDAAFFELEAAAAVGASEPHIAAAAAAKRRAYTVGVVRAVILAIGEAGLADQLVLPLAHAHVRPLRDALGPPSDHRFALVAREAVDGAYVSVDGLAMFGLPAIAVPLDGRPGRLNAAVALGGSLSLRGVRPRGGSFEAGGERFTIERLSGNQVWLEPVPNRDHALGRYQFAFVGVAEWALGAAWHRSVVGRLSRIDLFDVHGPQPLRIALTNGHGLAGRPEVLAIPPEITSRVLSTLELVAGGLGGQVAEWDRVAFPEPVGSIAGAILKPILAEPLAVHAGRSVELFDALPILVDELAAFRRDPTAHARWVDERYQREDYDAIHARWAAVG
jgi:hypothetical protein